MDKTVSQDQPLSELKQEIERYSSVTEASLKLSHGTYKGTIKVGFDRKKDSNK